MNSIPILVKKIFQSDNFHFTIEWSDGVSYIYRLSELQKCCPCAKCYDAKAEKQMTISVDQEVRASIIKSVGRYALKIQFTSGCSLGIYSFNFLRKMMGK